MTRRTLLTALFAVASLSAADEALPKAETILDRYIEVTGGKAAYESKRNQVATGTVEMVGKGIKGTMINYHSAPSQDYALLDLEAVGKFETGTDGETVWERSAIQGPHVKTGEERAAMLRDALFNGHLNWRKRYDKAETVGVGSVNGEDCYKVVMTPKDGKPVTEYYSKKSGLLLKSVSVRATQMGDISIETVLSDYKDAGGITMAFTQTQTFAGQEMVMHYDKVDFNVDIPKDRYQIPDDIKALAAKDTGAAK
jgi:hypothetical protein